MINEVKRGQFLKDLRKSNNMTQQQLGELLHYSNKAISKWEQGLSFPNNPATLQKLAELYNISVLELLYGERKTKQNEDKIEKNITNIYKNNYKRLTCSILITIFMTSLVIILGCIILYSCFIKGKIKSYVFQGESDLFRVNKSIILLTDEKNFLNFSGVKAKENVTIDYIKLYYYDTSLEDKTLMFGGTNDSYYFSIQKGYNDIDLEKVVKSKIYIEIFYNKVEKDSFELQLEEEYKNEKLVYSETDPISQKKELEENESLKDFLIKEGFSYDNTGFSKKEGNVSLTFNYTEGFYISKISEEKVEILTCSPFIKNAIYSKIAGEESEKQIISLKGEYNLAIEQEDFKNYYVNYLNYIKKNYKG